MKSNRNTFLPDVLGKLQWDLKSLKSGDTVSFLNMYSYLQSRKAKDFASIDHFGIDGIALLSLVRVFCGVEVERRSFDMTSLAPELFDHATRENKSIYFIGSRQEDMDRFISIIRQEYPQLNIAGWRNGYFQNDSERSAVIGELAHCSADYLVVGMGSPAQEAFLSRLKSAGFKGVAFTCGGFIHQTAGGLKYYPDFYNTYNLRWLYRMIDEPKLIRRYLIDYPVSLGHFLSDFFRMKLNRG